MDHIQFMRENGIRVNGNDLDLNEYLHEGKEVL